MLSQNGIARLQEIKSKVIKTLNSDESDNFQDPGLNDWRRHLNDVLFCGTSEEGFIVGHDKSGQPLKIDHLDDGDLDMVEGCLTAYLRGKGFRRQEG